MKQEHTCFRMHSLNAFKFRCRWSGNRSTAVGKVAARRLRPRRRGGRPHHPDAVVITTITISSTTITASIHVITIENITIITITNTIITPSSWLISVTLAQITYNVLLIIVPTLI